MKSKLMNNTKIKYLWRPTSKNQNYLDKILKNKIKKKNKKRKIE